MNNSVLIYSDFNDVVEESVTLLEKSGYIVFSAGNFNGAIDLITSADYEYFLVDDTVDATTLKYLISESRRCNPDAAVITFNAVESILTRFRHSKA
ncbi:MAG: hypothetical protein FI726_00840 [SAR202 cluster bacterium]|mgnify:FL=1|nr:hypothetical protein [SAR202 cluster bacterium]